MAQSDIRAAIKERKLIQKLKEFKIRGKARCRGDMAHSKGRIGYHWAPKGAGSGDRPTTSSSLKICSQIQIGHMCKQEKAEATLFRKASAIDLKNSRAGSGGITEC